MNTKKHPEPTDPTRIIITGSIFLLQLILTLSFTRFISLTTGICSILSVFILISWILIRTIGKRFSENEGLVWFPVSFREIPGEPGRKSTETKTKII